jgi:hypothetical protein
MHSLPIAKHTKKATCRKVWIGGFGICLTLAEGFRQVRVCEKWSPIGISARRTIKKLLDEGYCYFRCVRFKIDVFTCFREDDFELAGMSDNFKKGHTDERAVMFNFIVNVNIPQVEKVLAEISLHIVGDVF